jgi:CHAT domain-containing protein
MMTRIVMDAGGWHCNMHPQPTVDDLYRSIQSARQTNLQMLHLAGHAQKELGFIWNANDAATASKTFDVEEISCAIGEVAGQKGPLECVVLNACSTERMGRLLRDRGVPCVLCWKTQVRCV